jgi:biopolymer transport protein ExbB
MQKKNNIASILSIAVIPIALVVAIIIYVVILGDPHNFIDNNPELNPKQ